MICGLVLNELLVNAYKHAFVGKKSGEIIISLKQTRKDRIVLMVTDNGAGFEVDGPRVKDGKPNGQYIIQSLVDKLDGEITTLEILRSVQPAYFHLQIRSPICEVLAS